MSPKFVCIALDLLVFAAVAASARQPQSDSRPPAEEKLAAPETLTPAQLFARLSPAVVKLTALGEGGGEVRCGSGFVVSTPTPTTRDVLTNYHVVRPARDLNVEFANGAAGAAMEILSEDEQLDLALVRVEWVDWTTPVPQVTVDTKPTDRLPIGTGLFAIGSPMGMKNTLSDGLLSGYRSEERSTEWIQITNPISPGSSGGPVFTNSGALVGVTTASMPQAQNLNFAIPAWTVREFLARDKRPRPLWKGACVDCEEAAYISPIYRRLYDECRREGDCPKRSVVSLSSDSWMWTQGMVATPPLERFRSFLEAGAEAGVADAKLLLVCSRLGIFSRGEPGGIPEADVLSRLSDGAAVGSFFMQFLIGKSWLARGDYAAATGAFEDSRRANPGFAPTLFQLAESQMFLHRLRDALETSSQLVEQVPNSSRARQQRGVLLQSLGSKMDAIREFESACELDPYDEFAALPLVHLYLETGQNEKAIAASRRILKMRSGRDSTFNMHFHWSIARALVGLRRYSDAIDAYRAALSAAGSEISAEQRNQLESELAGCRLALGDSN